MLIERVKRESKGVSGIALYAILGLFVTSLIIAGLTGTYPEVLNFFKSEMTTLQDDRIVNSAYALSSTPSGYVEMEISGYEIKANDNMVGVRYAQTEAETEWADTPLNRYGYTVEGMSYTEVDGLLCIEKVDDSTLRIEDGGC